MIRLFARSYTFLAEWLKNLWRQTRQKVSTRRAEKFVDAARHYEGQK